MRRLLTLFLLLIATMPGWAQDLQVVATPGNVLRFELGTVKIPEGSQWKSKVQEELKLYVGVNPSDLTTLYMVTILKKPMRLGSDPAKEMQQFAEGMAESFASHQGGLDGPVESTPDARGGFVAFKTRSGSTIYGQLILGERDTLVFTTQNASRQQLDTFVSGFTPDPDKMAPPKPLKEVRQKLITAFAIGCMIINFLAGLLGGLVALALRGNFWRGAALTMTTLGCLEFVGALYFVSQSTGGSSFEQGEMAGYLTGSMLFGCGLPVFVAGLLGRRKTVQG